MSEWKKFTPWAVSNWRGNLSENRKVSEYRKVIDNLVVLYADGYKHFDKKRGMAPFIMNSTGYKKWDIPNGDLDIDKKAMRPL